MKRISYLLAFTIVAWSFQACNNTRSKDAVELANEANNGQDTADFRPVPDMGITDSENYTDADFAVKAADGGLAEVQLGELALANASNQRVKEFAQMMVDDHGASNKELMSIAEKKNIVLPTAPSMEKVRHMQALNEKSGADFDKDYMSIMIKEHQTTINLFENAAASSTDSEMKAFATKNLPILKKHLSEAESIEEAVKSN